MNRKADVLRKEISREIQKLPLYEKYNINVAEGIYLSIERGSGNDGLQFNPYFSHTTILDYDEDRYEYSEEYKVYEQLKLLIPKKNASLDYDCNKRILLLGDLRKTFGTSHVLKYAIIKFIKEFTSVLSNIDEIFICFWNYQERKAVIERIYY